jgi:hypothetical protein
MGKLIYYRIGLINPETLAGGFLTEIADVIARYEPTQNDDVITLCGFTQWAIYQWRSRLCNGMMPKDGTR